MMWRGVRSAPARLGALLRSNAGELLLGTGLVLIAWALWPVLGRMALVPVGLALVWIALPTRRWFVERPPLPDKKPRRA